MRPRPGDPRSPLPAGGAHDGAARGSVRPALTDSLARARQRLVPALLVAVTGGLALGAGLEPDAAAPLFVLTSAPDAGQQLGGRAVLALLGVVLLVAGRLLVRGSRAAWDAATATCASVLLAGAVSGAFGPVSGLALASLLALLVTRPAFSSQLAPGRRRGRQPAQQTCSASARALAERWGRSSTAPLLALPDNDRLPLCDGQALAGLSVRNGVALSLGVPVAPDGLQRRALAEFVRTCETAGWTPALLGLDDAQRRVVTEEGFTALKIGEEAFLDVASFSTDGKRRANVRHSVTRARKDGVVVLRYDDATRSPRRDAQLAAISAAWLADKGGPELGFTLGRFDLDRLDDQEVYAALTGEGTDDERVVGFVTWLPYDDGDAAVLDLMRRAEPCPPGVMECLVVDALADFAARGRRTASLGGVPLATTGDRTGTAQRAMGWAYERGGSVYAAKGLFRFKDKFDPDWQPMHLAYPRTADLPRIGVAVLRAFLPRGTVRALLSQS